MKVVKTRSIPNVDNDRLLDSLDQIHATVHTMDGLHDSNLGRRSLIDMGRKGLKIRDELTRRGITTGHCDCRWCNNEGE